MTEFSAGDAAIEGFRLASRKPVVILVWSLAQLLVSLALGVAMVLVVGSDMGRLGSADPSVWTDPTLRNQMFSTLLRVEAVTLPIAFIWGAVQSCAVYRALLRPEERGFFYLKLGADELRMLGLFLLYFLLGVAAYIVIVFGVVLLALLVGLVVGGMGKGAGQSAVGVILAMAAVIGPVGAVIWALVRLSMSGPMTFTERKIRLFASWKMTRGRGWALLGAYLISVVLGAVVMVIGSSVALLVSFALTHKGLGGLYQQAFRPDYQSLAAYFSLDRLVVVLVQALFLGLASAVWYAPAAEVYRMLVGGIVQPASVFGPADDETPPAPKGPWG